MQLFETHKLNYEILLQAGWDHKTLAQLQKALQIKEKRGYQACTKTQQRLLRTWRPAQEKVHADQVAFAKSNRTTGKDLEDKDHTQFLKVQLMGLKAQLEAQLLPGEQVTTIIACEEHLFSLRALRPTLSRTDTNVRRQVDKVVHAVEEDFAVCGRALQLDQDELRRFIRANWVGNWNARFDQETWKITPVALDAEWAPEFRATARQELALNAPHMWPSLRK